MDKLYFVLVFGIFRFSFIQHSFVSGTVNLNEFLSLTLSQKIALDKFRERVEPILSKNHMKQDIYLIRWLRSSNFDINTAEKSLQDSLKWRQENKIDSIQFESWNDMVSDYPLTVDTYDKVGQPIGVIDANEWDIRRAILQGKGQRLLRYFINMIENLIGQVTARQEKGMNVTHIVILMNGDGVNVVQQACPICFPLWIQFVQLMEKNYPLYLDEFIIIDAPPAVSVVFETVRPFFSKETRETLRIFGKNQWMTYLDKKIIRDQRRQQFGGTKPPFQF